MIVALNLFDIIPGQEGRYAQYLRAVQPILTRHGAKVLIYGLSRMVFWGDCRQEYCGLIAYPNLAALKSFSYDPDFLAIRPLRDDSTTNYILTTVEDFETMDKAAEYLESLAADHKGESHAQ